MIFLSRKLFIDFRHFQVLVFYHRTYSKTQNLRKVSFLLCFEVRFFPDIIVNVSFSLVKCLVTFMKFFIISMISGVSGDSGESTWPKIKPNYHSICVSIRFLERIDCYPIRLVSLSESERSNPSPL